MSTTNVGWADRLSAVNGWISPVIYSNDRWFDCLKHILYTVSSLSPRYTRDSRQGRNSSYVDMHYGRVSGGTFVLDGLIRALNINPRIISAAWPGMARHGALQRCSATPLGDSDELFARSSQSTTRGRLYLLSNQPLQPSSRHLRLLRIRFTVCCRRFFLSLSAADCHCWVPSSWSSQTTPSPTLLPPAASFSNHFIVLFT